jgi:hypothetical protein
MGKDAAFRGGPRRDAFITVHHRLSPVPFFLFFSVMPFPKEKESSTGDEHCKR